MLDILYSAERALPELLRQKMNEWQSLCVDYHPPFVDRLWRQWGEYRISLHRIHPCDPHEALFHPHPWPSAMRLVSGAYQMIIGYGETHEFPPVASKLILHAPDVYEMTHPNGWHAVVPLEVPSYSVMVSGKPIWRYPESAFPKLEPLQPADQMNLLKVFRGYYR